MSTDVDFDIVTNKTTQNPYSFLFDMETVQCMESISNDNEYLEDSCGCKGVRTCLVCEKRGKENRTNINKCLRPTLYYCDLCGCCYDQTDAWKQHPDHPPSSQDFPGIQMWRNFVSEEEEASIVDQMYSFSFVVSQSGRRKQDYGPKVNFKKKKVRLNTFTGLPSYSQMIYERMKSLQLLNNFIPVELCNLEYDPNRGSAIDPHFDDFWLWGEKLVTLNLLSDTYLCMTKDSVDLEVHIPLIQRSLLVVYGPARYEWQHGIHREDVKEKRIAVTLRELSKEFDGKGDNADVGQTLKDIALSFQGQPVHCVQD